MPWTTSRTWTTSEVVTAAMMNTHVRDNTNWLHLHHGARLWKSANQTVPSGNNDVITWNSEVYDTDLLHDTATNNSRITIPSGLDGFWQLTVKINTDADAANHNPMAIRFRKNAAGSGAGGTLLDVQTFSGHTNAGGVALVATYQLVAGDYLEAFFNSTSEARDVQGGTSSDSSLHAIYLGA